MGLYLYCLGGAGHPEPGEIAGIGGLPVQRLESEGFTAWVSAMPAAPAPSLDGVREHNQVVEAACSERTALPLRFGQWFPDPASVAAELRERRTALETSLARVAGALELGVRVLEAAAPVDEPPDRSTGRAYLEALARREGRTRAARDRGVELAGALREWLGDLVRDERVRPLGTSAGLVTVAHLVARHDIGGYNAGVRAFSRQYTELRFHFSGPWPPYGFADDEGAASR